MGCQTTQRRPFICPELWRRIFSFATRVEEDLSPLGADLFDGMHFERRQLAREEAAAVRRQIVLVCRWWRELATEFLYTHVSLGSFEQLSRFAETLRNYEPSHSPGWWTNRLDIRSITLTCGQYESQYADLVVQVLERCVNLVSFVFGDEMIPHHGDIATRVPTPPSILQALAGCSGRSLKRLEWDGPGAPSPKDLANFLPSCTQLRNICMTDCAENEQGEEVPGLAGLTFPHLQVLEVTPTSSWQLSTASTWKLPSLTDVSIMEPLSGESDIQTEALEKFFTLQGERVLTLTFIIVQNFDLGPVCNFCPRLQEIVFTLSSGFYPLRGAEVQKAVRRVGIYNLHTYIPWGQEEAGLRRGNIAELDDGLDMLEKHLSELSSVNFPALKTIRLFHFTSSDGKDWIEKLESRSGWWQGWVSKLGSRAIRFEGHDGQLIETLLPET